MSGFDKGANVTHDKPHARPDNLNPKTNGPFLDDIRAEQERAYREARTKSINAQAEKAQAVEDDNEAADADSVAEDEDLELDLHLDGDEPENENDDDSDGE